MKLGKRIAAVLIASVTAITALSFASFGAGEVPMAKAKTMNSGKTYTRELGFRYSSTDGWVADNAETYKINVSKDGDFNLHVKFEGIHSTPGNDTIVYISLKNTEGKTVAPTSRNLLDGYDLDSGMIDRYGDVDRVLAKQKGGVFESEYSYYLEKGTYYLFVVGSSMDYRYFRENKMGKGVSKSCKMTIDASFPDASASGELSGIGIKIKKGSSITLDGIIVNNGKGKEKIKWSSSDTSVATVSSKGVVKAKKKGTTTITAKLGTSKVEMKITVT